MKSSKKALAFALAAAMVVTAVPVAPAEAASTAKLSAKSVTVAAGTAKKQSKTIKVTTPSTWKSVKVTAKPSSSSIAKASVSGKTVKITAVKKGTAKVTVTVTAKKSGKKVTKKLTATAKVVNAGLKVTAPTEVVVGSETKLTTKVCPSAAKTTFKSSDDTIATVDENGTVKAVKAGDVTITTTTDYGKSVESKIVVKKAILKDVKQTETNKLEATIEGDTSSLKANDFVITNTYSKANFAVKSVTVDSTDKTKITIETFVAMTDGKDYTVELDGTTKTITATDNKAVAATIAPATVTVPTPPSVDGKNANDIKATFTDANGVKLFEVTPSTATTVAVAQGFALIDFKVDATNNGYLSGDTLTLYKAGNTAKVTVTAHTGKYDVAAQEIGNITAEATITGVDAVAVTTTGWNTKFISGTTTATEFKNVKETKIAVGDAITAYIQKVTSDNKTAKVDAGYTFDSSNADVMTVVAATDLSDATALTVNAYKEGSAYIIVKDTKKNVVTTIPVTIGAKRKAVSLTLDKTNVVLSDKTATSDVVVKASAKDQYNEDFPITSGLTCKTADGKTTITPVANVITIDKSNFANITADVTTTYVVSYGDFKAVFTITVKKSGKTKTYDLVLSADTADAIVKADANGNTKITATLQGFDSNGVVSEASVENVTYTVSKDGKDVTADAVGAISDGVINVNDITTGKQMSNGTYLVTATTADKKEFKKTFTVTNSQPVAVASLTKTELDNKTTLLKNILKVVYDGKELKADEFDVVGDTAITATKNFDKITVKITVASRKYVQQEISLGKTVIVK